MGTILRDSDSVNPQKRTLLAGKKLPDRGCLQLYLGLDPGPCDSRVVSSETKDEQLMTIADDCLSTTLSLADTDLRRPLLSPLLQYSPNCDMLSALCLRPSSKPFKVCCRLRFHRLDLIFISGFVSCRRIEKYMSLDEVAAIEPYEGNGDIILNNATFTWPRDESAIKAGTTVNGTQSTPATPKKAFTLANMTLRFPAGELSLICGRLGMCGASQVHRLGIDEISGSGKSLLLAGLLGEADLLAGQVDCPRSRPNAMSDIDAKSTIPENEWIVSDMVAYVPQQAWLQNASIKDNVIFSSPWDPVRYQKVLEACSLISDLEILEDGDET